MVKGSEVLEMLIPQGGWAIVGNDYEGIQFLECEPISKADFEKGFAQYENWKANKEAENEAKKATALAKLLALGLDEDDLKALGI